jgi:hypothetical protein
MILLVIVVNDNNLWLQPARDLILLSWMRYDVQSFLLVW